MDTSDQFKINSTANFTHWDGTDPNGLWRKAFQDTTDTVSSFAVIDAMVQARHPRALLDSFPPSFLSPIPFPFPVQDLLSPFLSLYTRLNNHAAPVFGSMLHLVGG